jgi:DNA-binding response OmpR family regulator
MVKNIKLLLAEDEAALGKIIKESLETRGFEVVLCDNGEKAFEKYKSETPEILVLDVMMPKKDGFTLAKEIRAIDDAIPIIFLTAKSQTADVVEGFSIGGNDYLKKPFSMEELIVRIILLIFLSSNCSLRKKVLFN